eukprot:931056-Pleurochrysis_carterae.AAC.1
MDESGLITTPANCAYSDEAVEMTRETAVEILKSMWDKRLPLSPRFLMLINRKKEAAACREMLKATGKVEPWEMELSEPESEAQAGQPEESEAEER